ncbi:MAG: efflux transporter outer membrane subunit [Planctomycetes bacterium]|nr:efflux transporter outer membrane subunit [Planctomycetota bacterium]
MSKKLIFTIVLAALAGACTVGPDYKQPVLPAPPEWKESGAGLSSQPADLARWWNQLNDPQLCELVEKALHNNLDLQLAGERVREARAIRGVAASKWYPSLDANASYNRERLSRNNLGSGASGSPGFNPNIDAFSATLDASWELDIFGGTKRSVEAADADIAASYESRREVYVALLAELATSYVELRGFQHQLAIVKQRVDSQQKTLDLTRVRFDTGLASELDVARATALLENTKSLWPALDASVRQAAHRIGVLSGEFPGALVSELITEKPVPAPPAAMPLGAPADILLRRPDLRRAERECAAATARVGVAVADKYPKITLSSSVGPKSNHLGDLFDHRSIFFSIGPSIHVPLFEGGRIDANIEVQNARESQAILQYKQKLLSALEEVENGIVQYTRQQLRRDALASSLASQERALALAKSLYEQGLVDFLNVLEAERELLDSQNSFVQSQTQVTLGSIFLFKALGGGWEEAL